MTRKWGSMCVVPVSRNNDYYTCTAVQSQKAVSAYFTSKQILYFGFAEHCSTHTTVIIDLSAPHI